MFPASNSSFSMVVQSWHPLQPAATHSMRIGPSNEVRKSSRAPLSTSRSKVGAEKEIRSGTGDRAVCSSVSAASSIGAAVHPASSERRTMTERNAREVFIGCDRPVLYINACSKSEVENPVNRIPPCALDGQHQASSHRKICSAKPLSGWPDKNTKPN